MVGLLSLGLAPRQTFDFPAASTGVGAAFWLGVVVNDSAQMSVLGQNKRPESNLMSEISQLYQNQVSFIHFCPGSTWLLVSWLLAPAGLCLRAWYVRTAATCVSCCVFVIRTHVSSSQMAVAVSVNLAGAIVAVVGVVLFAVDLGSVSVVWMCRGYSDEKNNCLKVAHIAQVPVE